MAVGVAIGVAAGALVVAALASLKWRYQHDSPLMIYAGFLVSGGAVPYRDFFDMNMPGTYFVMAAMGRVFGWNDLGFRIFDLLCLTSLCGLTFLWMRRFGRQPAFAASVAFPLWYLIYGPSMSVQREYLALLPFSGMLALATGDGGLTRTRRVLFAGVLGGVAILIKPLFVLLFPPLFFVLPLAGAISISVRRRAAVFVAGMAVPAGGMFLYLLCTGSLRAFVDIAVNYWPLYTRLTSWHVAISGLHRFVYVVGSVRDGVMGFYAPMAIIGLIVLDADRTQGRTAWALGGLLAAATVYPAVSGQFWGYHWMPFFYVAICAASLAARAAPGGGRRLADMAPAAAAIFLLLSLASVCGGQMGASEEGKGGDKAPKGGVPDEICRFLRSHMKPGDTVQPLDWAGGAVHGMLMARAPLATRFMYDFYFYHHVSSPYIGRLRREFMEELAVKKPRFIIQVLENRPWPTGTDTTREFPELQAFLERGYTTALEGGTYRILERRDSDRITGWTGLR